MHGPGRIMVVVLLCVMCGGVLAQTANLTYTNDYPSIERVKAEIKGSDPTHTLARQVGVFAYLSAEIQRIKLNRDYTGAYTPDESHLVGAYNLAPYHIVQAYNTSHTQAQIQ